MDKSVNGFKVDPSVFVVGASHDNVTALVPSTTARVVVPDMVPNVAVIVVVPAFHACASPLEPVAL